MASCCEILASSASWSIASSWDAAESRGLIEATLLSTSALVSDCNLSRLKIRLTPSHMWLQTRVHIQEPSFRSLIKACFGTEHAAKIATRTASCCSRRVGCCSAYRACDATSIALEGLRECSEREGLEATCRNCSRRKQCVQHQQSYHPGWQSFGARARRLQAAALPGRVQQRLWSCAIININKT